MVGLVVPSNDTNLLRTTGNASQSPFVIAATRSGIKVIPSIINAAVLTSAWSSGNSSLLTGSRILYGLSLHNNAPRLFSRLNQFKIPYVAVLFFGLFMLLGFMTLSDSASMVFTWLQDLVAVATLTNWIIIMVTYLRLFYACKRQGIARQYLPWAAPLQPYLSWVALFLMISIMLTGGFSTFIKGHWNSEVFVSSYINLPIVAVLFVGHKYVRKTRTLSLDEVPITQLLDIAGRNPEPVEEPLRGVRKMAILWS